MLLRHSRCPHCFRESTQDEAAAEQERKALEAQAAKAREQKEREIELARKRREEEANRKKKIADLTAELQAIGVTEVVQVGPGEDLEAAILRLLKKKAEVQLKKEQELSTRLQSRLRRADYLARALRAREATKAEAMEEKLSKAQSAYVNKMRDRLATKAFKTHQRAFYHRMQLQKAAPALPSIFSWVQERQQAKWMATLVSCLLSPASSSAGFAVFALPPTYTNRCRNGSFHYPCQVGRGGSFYSPRLGRP